MAPKGHAEKKKAAASRPRATRQAGGAAQKKGRGRPRAKAETPALFPVVGIGASAGGVEATTAFLSGLPSAPGMAFVVVQHLAPAFPSLLTEVLRNATAMPIEEIRHGVRLEPDHVYVISPNVDLAIRKGRFDVVARNESRRPQMPIDRFFRSLAEERKTAAIGVVLSGTANDGTDGLAAIKAAGGFTFAQEPRSAQYPAMPQNAIDAGAVDYVLPPRQIAAELTRLARHPYLRRSAKEPEHLAIPKDEEQLVTAICVLLRDKTGVDFTAYKPGTIRRRLGRRMTLTHLEAVQKYYERLEKDPSEVQALYEDLLIHVTGFFRDPPLFRALNTLVFPQILAQKRDEELRVRIWVPGCSTGEEVYSIAIALSEFLGETSHRASMQIFGSDVSEPAIDRARSGTFSAAVLRDVNEKRLARFFTKVEGGFRINQSIRDACVFVRHDVTRDPPFTRVDLVSCRNVLIYFGQELQKKAIPLFHYALNQPGFLVLGRTESIGGFSHLFSLVDRANKVFARKPASVRLVHRFLERAGIAVPRLAPVAARHVPSAALDFSHEADRLLQARYGPPAVVVNEALEILSTRGRTGSYLELPPGEARLGLLSMAREGLLADLRAALARAKTADVTVRREGARVRAGGSFRAVNIEVTPFRLAPPAKDRYFLVAFEEPPPGRAETPPAAPGKRATPRERRAETRLSHRLEDELAATKDYLQSVVEDHAKTGEDLAATNEEMLSANEELQSTNEELETAKEELQSANEELTTVNDELQTRNAELVQSQGDILNIMASVDVPVILVDNDRRIRRFVPDAVQVMNLIPSDVGRPIRDITPNIDAPDLDARIARVVQTRKGEEAEVRDRDGHWYSLRIRPYTTKTKEVEGAVVSLVDIDVHKRAVLERERLLEEARRERGLLEAVIEQLPEGVVVAEAPSGKLLLWNPAAEEILGDPPAAESLAGVHGGKDPDKPIEWLLARSLHTAEVVKGERISVPRAGGGGATLLASSSPVRARDGRVFAGVATFLDITGEAEVQRSLREQNLLADTGKLLEDATDSEATLQAATRLVVPAFADWCLLAVWEEEEPRRRVVALHADPDKAPLALDLARELSSGPPPPKATAPAGHAARPELHPEVPDLAAMARVLGLARPEVLRDLGTSSYIRVPLTARARVFGALSLVRGEARERYDERALRVAEDVGRRVAAAIDAAWLYRGAMEAIRLRNEFLSIASHELRTPMTALYLQVQNFRRIVEASDEGRGSPEARENGLKLMERQVRRLNDLMNAIMDVSLVTSGQLKLQLGPMDLVAVVQDVVSRFEEPARRAGSTIRTRGSGPIRGNWDPIRIEQVVGNLLSNAIKYGGGKPIEVSLDADPSRVRLEVRDHGIGIAADDLPRLFGRFERAVSARRYVGLGMGLYISRQIVEAHGGTIHVASEPGKGSTFTVELPREPRVALPKPERTA